MPATFGEFTEVVREIAQRWPEAEACFDKYLEPYLNLVSWDKFQQTPLSEDSVVNLINCVAMRLGMLLIANADSSSVEQQKKDGEDFIQAIAAAARERGIQVDSEFIELPLSPSDLVPIFRSLRKSLNLESQRLRGSTGQGQAGENSDPTCN